MQARSLTPAGDAGHSAWPTKPNVILWLVDDQGWGNAGLHNENVLTPQMDRLAHEEGVVLMRHYTYPWCAPSRSALMTGIMPHLGLQTDQQRIPQSVVMLPQVMKAAGYSTHHIGKWHLGMLRTWQYPSSRGFDTSVGYMNGGEDYLTQRVGAGDHDDWACDGIDFLENAQAALGRNGTFSTQWISSELTRTIQNGKAPLFLFVALQAMHSPSPGPEQLAGGVGKYAAAGISDERFAQSNTLITMADGLLAHAAGLLREQHMWDNTLLIHLSDNGGQVTDPTGTAYHGPPPGAPWPSQGNNWPLRGMKRSFFEGGVRVPAFVTGGALPSTMRGKRLSGYIHLADWFLTIAELAGSDQVPSRHGSMSMVGFLDGTSGSPRKGIVLGAGETGSTCNNNEAVIHGSWKLINGSIPCEWATWQAPLFPNVSASTSTESRQEQDTKAARYRAKPGQCVEKETLFLFNIEDDPTEQVNLAETHPDEVALMLTRLAQARADAETDPFERNHDHAVHDRASLCAAYRDAHGGFLGPYMDDVMVEEVTRVEASRVRDPDPLAFAAPDTYTDEC